MLKNLILYRLGPEWPTSADQLVEALAGEPFAPCAAAQQKSTGWVPPREEHADDKAVQSVTDALVPAVQQFQARDGTWHNFVDERHFQNTVEEGSWPLRNLYTQEAINTLRAQLAEAQREAVSLARSLFKRHYAQEPHYASGEIEWEPFNEPASVITQIDNMIAGICAQLAEAKRDAEVNRQINRACAELPDDYCIAIEIERDAGWVCLLRGDEVMDFDDPCEDIASSISAATEAAKEQS